MSKKFENFEELIDRSKELSKKKFLTFAKGIYDVDETVFEHLWDIPIIPSYKGDSLITTTLSTKDEDDILDILDEVIESKLGESEAVFIPFDALEFEFEDDEKEEYKSRLNNGEIEENFNAFIAYNESKLKKELKELFEHNNNKLHQKTEEELHSIFIEYAAKIFTHERCHLNANTLQVILKEFDPNMEDFEKEELEITEEINGAMGSFDSKNDYNNENEVLLETLSDMIFAYEEGDNLEDCLQKVLNDGNLFTDINPNIVNKVRISMVLFTDEIIEWAMFGAYEPTRKNVLLEKINSVFGENNKALINTDIIRKTREYCNSMVDNSLSTKQIEMLETLGIKNLITQQDMKDVAMSEDAMKQIRPAALDIDAILAMLSNDGPEITD